MKISTFGTMLVVVGVLFLLQNTNAYQNAIFDLWPAILIAMGFSNVVNAFE